MVDKDSITIFSNNAKGIFTGSFSFQRKEYGIFEKLCQLILIRVFGKKQNPSFTIKKIRRLKSVSYLLRDKAR